MKKFRVEFGVGENFEHVQEWQTKNLLKNYGVESELIKDTISTALAWRGFFR